MFEMLALSFL